MVSDPCVEVENPPGMEAVRDKIVIDIYIDSYKIVIDIFIVDILIDSKGFVVNF